MEYKENFMSAATSDNILGISLSVAGSCRHEF
jgi:hypothetical protein